MRSVLACGLCALLLLPMAAHAQDSITRLTPQAQEWLKKNPGKQLVRYKISNIDFVFKGDFNHKGVNLTAQEVLNIQADHVSGHAQRWAQQWNENPDNQMFRYAGIEYIGPSDKEWWEEKGTSPGSPVEGGRRYHKFGGKGKAYILTYQ